MSLTKATFSMLSGAVYNVLDYGADATGGVDSTAAVQTAVNLAEGAGGGAIYIPSGTFLINGKVNIGGSNIRVYGDGSSSILLKASTATQAATLYLTGGVQNNLEFDHLNFNSTRTTSINSYGSIDGELGTGIFKNISIHDNIFSKGSDGSIAVIFAMAPGASTDGLSIVNNTFEDILQAGIAILNQNSDSTIRFSNVKIIGNKFKDCQQFCMTISGPAQGLIISNNVFSGTNGYGIEHVAGIKGSVIANNVFGGSFTQIMSFSGSSPYPANSNVIVRDNTTAGAITADWTLQSCSLITFDGNNFNTSGSMIFSGVNLGITAWLTNNRINNGYQNINGAVVTAYNNYIATYIPRESGFFKDVQLSGGGTTSTIVITTVGNASWTPYAVRVTCTQVEGTGSGGGSAESVIAFRYLNGTSAVQISKTDLVTSANIALTTSYGTNQVTVTATSGVANVLQLWKVEFLSSGLSSIV